MHRRYMRFYIFERDISLYYRITVKSLYNNVRNNVKANIKQKVNAIIRFSVSYDNQLINRLGFIGIRAKRSKIT